MENNSNTGNANSSTQPNNGVTPVDSIPTNIDASTQAQSLPSQQAMPNDLTAAVNGVINNSVTSSMGSTNDVTTTPAPQTNVDNTSATNTPVNTSPTELPQVEGNMNDVVNQAVEQVSSNPQISTGLPPLPDEVSPVTAMDQTPEMKNDEVKKANKNTERMQTIIIIVLFIVFVVLAVAIIAMLLA